MIPFGQIQFKLLPIILVLLLVFLQYKLWYGTGGIKNMVALKKQLTSQTQINDVLKKQNHELLQQVRYLRTNKDAIEARARQELGMIKKGETFYQIIK
ncbi:MAG: ftsB [Gammaproteobacteria bacterium]|jgi:cell division protein FtsB|nr:ftsB [Gammaproteobacteria bacterium]